MTRLTEVWMAVAYAAFLLTASSGLAWLSRRTARGPLSRWVGRRGRRDPARDAEAPWPHSDAARFERGLSLVLVVLAGFILSVTALRHPTETPVLLGALLLVAALACRPWLARAVGHRRRRRPHELTLPPSHDQEAAAFSRLDGKLSRHQDPEARPVELVEDERTRGEGDM